jgi:hypothetical protein
MRLQGTLIAACLIAGAISPVRAQDTERAAVLATAQKLFTGMRTRDTALITQAFDSTARMVGVSRDGSRLSLTAPSRFAGSVAGAPAGNVWNERIFEPEVRIEGDLAQVWTYYTFHLNGKFSHCGVDAFMLRKVGGAWKITQLADTQRKEGCTHTETIEP